MWEVNYGFVDIYYWEYVVLFFYVVVLFLFFARRQRLKVKDHPEYRYLVPA
ncbi:MAG: hypothetical protein JNM91_02050, partial [Flavobacteriales bacterium]|nr:hypothetical protein [Flavobacteriales bacterium]